MAAGRGADAGHEHRPELLCLPLPRPSERWKRLLCLMHLLRRGWGAAAETATDPCRGARPPTSRPPHLRPASGQQSRLLRLTSRGKGPGDRNNRNRDRNRRRRGSAAPAQHPDQTQAETNGRRADRRRSRKRPASFALTLGDQRAGGAFPPLGRDSPEPARLPARLHRSHCPVNESPSLVPFYSIVSAGDCDRRERVRLVALSGWVWTARPRASGPLAGRT